MKKIIIILFIMLLALFLYGYLSGMLFQGDKIPPGDVGEFKGVISAQDINLDEKEGISGQEIVIDEKLALEIGNAVIKSVFDEHVIKETEYRVFELRGKDSFVVSRLPRDKLMLGGDYNVAISKIDGRILKVWMGE